MGCHEEDETSWLLSDSGANGPGGSHHSAKWLVPVEVSYSHG